GSALGSLTAYASPVTRRPGSIPPTGRARTRTRTTSPDSSTSRRAPAGAISATARLASCGSPRAIKRAASRAASVHRNWSAITPRPAKHKATTTTRALTAIAASTVTAPRSPCRPATNFDRRQPTPLREWHRGSTPERDRHHQPDLMRNLFRRPAAVRDKHRRPDLPLNLSRQPTPVRDKHARLDPGRDRHRLPALKDDRRGSIPSRRRPSVANPSVPNLQETSAPSRD